ncbi:hypothetical protein ACFVVM_06525 [Nocardia sp. NPDC058176]|uniref:hypothetical protein n=1 Tax=Nocardia sp. NPDC058176 TaxID=3346368 RepID=UPI0036DA7504
MTTNDSHAAQSATNSVPRPCEGRDFTDLAARMADAPPLITSPNGDYTGTIVAVIGLHRLPRPFRIPLTRTLALLGRPLWRGKRFTADTGTNLWLTHRSFGTFVPGTPRAEAIPLDYDHPTNPRPLRRITGELTQLGPAVYLGAMSIGRRRLMYFTLHR